MNEAVNRERGLPCVTPREDADAEADAAPGTPQAFPEE